MKGTCEGPSGHTVSHFVSPVVSLVPSLVTSLRSVSVRILTSPTHAVHSVLSPSHPGPRALLRSPLATEPSAIHSLLTSLVHERSEVNGVSGARKGQRAGRYSRRSSAPLSSLSSSISDRVAFLTPFVTPGCAAY